MAVGGNGGRRGVTNAITVMPADSSSQNSVASLAYVAGIDVLIRSRRRR
jgi:hypothetical protein